MRFVFRKIKRLDLHGNVRDFEIIQTMFFILNKLRDFHKISSENSEIIILMA